MAFRKGARRFVKKAGKAVVSAAKKRYTKGGKVNVMRIASDAAKLVRLMNVEKKYIDNSRSVNGDFSQLSTLSAGYFIEEVTPQIQQGVTGSARTGNSVKLVSARLDFQVRGQSSTINELRYKYYLICKPDALITSFSQVVTECFDVNLFGANYDYHSLRDPEHFKNYKIVAQGSGKLIADSLSGQLGINQAHRYLKLNHHLKYDSNVSSSPVVNKFFLVFFADSGDKSTNTGATLDWGMRTWFVDN